jgi:branched-chain amino acid transport system ATP-binding protein
MTPAAPLLTVTGLVKRFGGIVVSDRVDFDLKHGEVHALIGPNGAGKTTFINLLSGEIAPNEGRIAFDGRDITRASTSSRALMGLVRSYQVTSVVQEFTALENVMLAVQARNRRNYQFTRDVRGDASLTRPARAVLEQIGLGAKQNFRVANLAHGERRQL